MPVAAGFASTRERRSDEHARQHGLLERRLLRPAPARLRHRDGGLLRTLPGASLPTPGRRGRPAPPTLAAQFDPYRAHCIAARRDRRPRGSRARVDAPGLRAGGRAERAARQGAHLRAALGVDAGAAGARARGGGRGARARALPGGATRRRPLVRAARARGIASLRTARRTHRSAPAARVPLRVARGARARDDRRSAHGTARDAPLLRLSARASRWGSRGSSRCSSRTCAAASAVATWWWTSRAVPSRCSTRSSRARAGAPCSRSTSTCSWPRRTACARSPRRAIRSRAWWSRSILATATCSRSRRCRISTRMRSRAASSPPSGARLTQDPLKPLQDRAVAGQFPPGSTYKPFVAAIALQEKVRTPSAGTFCPGSFTFGSRAFRCWKKTGHGTVDLHRAIVQSCDVYFYRAGLDIGVDRMAEYMKSFGFGAPTGIGLENERGGINPSSEWKRRRFDEPWMAGETVSISIGQGYVSVTPLQLAVAYGALGTGQLVPTAPRARTHRARRHEDGGAGGRGAAAADRGGAPGARARRHSRCRRRRRRHRPARAGAGAGRRRQDGHRAGREARTHRRHARERDIPWKYRDHAWFAAIAPVDAPEIAVVVLSEHGGHGGSAAGADRAARARDAGARRRTPAAPHCKRCRLRLGGGRAAHAEERAHAEAAAREAAGEPDGAD